MILFALLMGLLIGGLVALSWRTLQDVTAVLMPSFLPWFDGDSKLDEMLNDVMQTRQDSLFASIGTTRHGQGARKHIANQIIQEEIDEFIESQNG